MSCASGSLTFVTDCTWAAEESANPAASVRTIVATIFLLPILNSWCLVGRVRDSTDVRQNRFDLHRLQRGTISRHLGRLAQRQATVTDDVHDIAILQAIVGSTVAELVRRRR